MPLTLIVAALLVGYLIAAWGFALPMPFITDDYLILARVREAGFADLWSRESLRARIRRSLAIGALTD